MTNSPDVRVIGEMHQFSAMTLLHEEAIYLHQAVQYQVEKLDWEEKKPLSVKSLLIITRMPIWRWS